MSETDAGTFQVLALAWEYPPRIVGGLATHVAGLSRALSRRQIPITVLTPGGSGRPRVVQEEGVRVLRLGTNPFAHAEMLTATGEMNRLFTALAADVVTPDTIVHAHDWMTTTAACAIAGRFHLPLVATFHSSEMGRSSHIFGTPRPDRTIMAFEQELFSSARACITPSQAMAEELCSTYGDRAVDVIANGIDLPHGVARRPVPGRILYAGRLVIEKGVWFVLHALAQLEGAHLVVAGTGPELSSLRREAAALHIADRVTFVGHLTPEALARQREEAQVAVVPSLYEPFGLVGLEAMAWGVPLVATNVGGLREFTEGAALLVPPGDADALARALQRILQHPSLQADLARQGLATVRQYSWDRCATSTDAVYRRAAGL